MGVIDEDQPMCRLGHVNSSGHVGGWQVVHGGRQWRDGQHLPVALVHGALQRCQPLHLLEGGTHHFGGLLHRRVRAALGHEGEDPVTRLEGAQHDGQHGRADAVAQNGAARVWLGTRVVQRQLFGATEKVGIVGKLILQGLEILWLEWKSADQTSEVIDAVLAQGHDAFADHAAALGGLARLIRSARQDGAVAIGRRPYGHSVRVRVAHGHHEYPQALLGV